MNRLGFTGTRALLCCCWRVAGKQRALRGVQRGFCGETAESRTNDAWLTAWPARGYIAIYAEKAFENPIPRSCFPRCGSDRLVLL
jgi:hypothetical protein